MEIQEENIVSLEELILREKDGMDKEVIEIESIDNEDKREDNDVKFWMLVHKN